MLAAGPALSWLLSRLGFCCPLLPLSASVFGWKSAPLELRWCREIALSACKPPLNVFDILRGGVIDECAIMPRIGNTLPVLLRNIAQRRYDFYTNNRTDDERRDQNPG